MEELKYFSMISMEIFYTENNKDKSKKINILFVSEEDYYTRYDMASSQDQALKRFSAIKGDFKGEVHDVHINAISALGHMSEATFHKGFMETPSPMVKSETLPEANTPPVYNDEEHH